MQEFAKKYQVWWRNDGERETYSYSEYDTLAECVSGQCNTPWFITKRVVIQVQDADELPVLASRQYVRSDTGATPSDEAIDEFSPTAAAYLSGPIGTLA